MMNADIFGALVAFVSGCLVSFLNFLISRLILKKCARMYAASTVFRQIIQVLFLVIIFFFADKTPWDLWYLLIGGVLGITLPMFFFTGMLLKINRTVNEQAAREEEKSDG